MTKATDGVGDVVVGGHGFRMVRDMVDTTGSLPQLQFRPGLLRCYVDGELVTPQEFQRRFELGCKHERT